MSRALLKHLPNALTLLRLLCALPIGWSVLTRSYDLALLLFALASVSDALDGMLARRFGWLSRLGALLDPLADKLLLVICYLCLTWIQLVPWWLAAVVFGRDVLLIGGGWLGHSRGIALAIEPNTLGKISTFLQMLLVVVLLLEHSTLATALGLGFMLQFLVLCSTLLSGLAYGWRWVGQISVHNREHSQ